MILKFSSFPLLFILLLLLLSLPSPSSAAFWDKLKLPSSARNALDWDKLKLPSSEAVSARLTALWESLPDSDQLVLPDLSGVSFMDLTQLSNLDLSQLPTLDLSQVSLPDFDPKNIPGLEKLSLPGIDQTKIKAALAKFQEATANLVEDASNIKYLELADLSEFVEAAGSEADKACEKLGCNKKIVLAVVAGVVTVVAVPIVVPATASLIGFGSAGITASSPASVMMSASAILNGGGVAAGSVVATLQSVGAAGVSMSTALASGAGVTASILAKDFSELCGKCDAAQKCDDPKA